MALVDGDRRAKGGKLAAASRETFVVTLQAEPRTDGIRSLKAFLKTAACHADDLKTDIQLAPANVRFRG